MASKGFPVFAAQVEKLSDKEGKASGGSGREP